MIHHWKALVLYFQNLQNNLQKLNSLSQNPVSENVCKKIVQKMENFTFLKSPRLCHLNISIYSNIFKILKNLIFNKETKNVQISFAFFSQKLMQSFPMSKAFQKAKFYQKSDKWKWVKTKIQFVTGKSSHSGSVLEDSGSQY